MSDKDRTAYLANERATALAEQAKTQQADHVAKVLKRQASRVRQIQSKQRQSPQTEHAKAREEERIKRMGEYEDHDGMTPTTCAARPFDDLAANFDENVHRMQIRIDPLNRNKPSAVNPPAMSTHMAWNPVEKRNVQVRYDLFDKSRRVLWDLHVSDPVKFTPLYIANTYGMTLAQSRGILLLEAVRAKNAQFGLAKKNRDAAVTRKERRQWLEDNEMTENDVDYSMQHDDATVSDDFSCEQDGEREQKLDRQYGEWYLVPGEPVSGTPQAVTEYQMVDENWFSDIQHEERRIHQRFQSRQKREEQAEKDQFAKYGPLGMHALYLPELHPLKANAQPNKVGEVRFDLADEEIAQLDTRLFIPSKAHTTLTDISEAKHSRFAFAIKDATGVTRSPNVYEYTRLRRREAEPKRPFSHIEYKPQMTIPF